MGRKAGLRSDLQARAEALFLHVIDLSKPRHLGLVSRKLERLPSMLRAAYEQERGAKQVKSTVIDAEET